MLGSRPARNELVKWKRKDSGEAEITVTRQENWKIRLLSKVFYIPQERTIIGRRHDGKLLTGRRCDDVVSPDLPQC